MRNHAEIIRTAGEDRIVAVTKRSVNTVRSWVRRDSIPAPEWAGLIAAQIATPDELIAAAARRAA